VLRADGGIVGGACFLVISERAIAMNWFLIAEVADAADAVATDPTSGMIWYIISGAIIVGVATVSILGKWEIRRDVKTGRPEYISIGNYTGIWNRQKLAELFGPPDQEDRYTVDVGQVVRIPKSLWLHFTDVWVLDGLCFAGCMIAMGLLMTQHSAAGIWLLVLCGGYQLACWTSRVWGAMTSPDS